MWVAYLDRDIKYYRWRGGVNLGLFYAVFGLHRREGMYFRVHKALWLK